jgi:hypothetical protein
MCVYLYLLLCILYTFLYELLLPDTSVITYSFNRCISMLLQYDSMLRVLAQLTWLARTRSRSYTRIRGCASWGELRFIQNEADMPNSMDRVRALIIADKQFPI